MSNGIIIAPLINDGLNLLALLVPVLATIAGGYLTAKFGSKWSAQQKLAVATQVSALADRGAQFALNHAESAVSKLGPVTSGNPKVDAVANYVALQGPELLKTAGIDITTDEGRQALVRLGMARVAGPVAPGAAIGDTAPTEGGIADTTAANAAQAKTDAKKTK